MKPYQRKSNAQKTVECSGYCKRARTADVWIRSDVHSILLWRKGGKNIYMVFMTLESVYFYTSSDEKFMFLCFPHNWQILRFFLCTSKNIRDMHDFHFNHFKTGLLTDFFFFSPWSGLIPNPPLICTSLWSRKVSPALHLHGCTSHLVRVPIYRVGTISCWHLGGL